MSNQLSPDQLSQDQALQHQGNSTGIFNGLPQYENFAQMQRVYSVATMDPPAIPFTFPQGQKVSLPTTYDYDGKTRNLYCLLGGTHTSALLILKRGEIRFEEYWLTGCADTQWISFSVAKSFVSALVGIAQQEGQIKSLDDTMEYYVPLFKGKAYDGVRIKDVLEMSSGARWNEDYSDPESEIFRLSVAGNGGSFDEFMRTMVAEREAGTLCRYNSADTQALAMLIAEATGRSLTDYMQEKLFQPLGMEQAGYWIVDVHGREMAYAGLLMTARDFAKFGELYRLKGSWQGQQIVPADYVSASTQPQSPHTQPNKPVVGDHVLGPGYGYQWWIPAAGANTFAAIGVYNQFIFVDPERETVIVKLSANPAYGTTNLEEDNKDNENLAALLAISEHIAETN